MDGISVDSGPIIRAYIDLNLETLYNVRPFGVFAFPEQIECTVHCGRYVRGCDSLEL